MKKLPIWVFAAAALALPAQGATTPLPESAAGALGSASERGFILRVSQAPEGAEIPNNYLRALQQLNGTLVDSSGASIPDEANPGPNPDGTYPIDTLNFELEAVPFDVIDFEGNPLWYFEPDFFPGIPGANGHTTKFVAEAVAFLELPAGETTFGVSVGTDRTDVNDDDSYVVNVGEVPRDFFATKVGEFERNAPAFSAGTHGENQWTVSAPRAGIYPFRLVHWQGGRGANLQFYTVLDTGERVLVNDTADSRAIKAYRRSSLPAAGAPYVGEVAPLPGSAGNSPDSAIEAVVLDGARAVQDASLQLTLNGQSATAARQRTGNRVAVSHSPDPSRSDPANAVRLTFGDAAGTTTTRDWNFTINATGGGSAPVSGQWDFENGNLAATVGTALEYLVGDGGLTQAGTLFGTTGEEEFAELPGINGEAAKVMRVPGDLDRAIGYVMTHGIAPNGGGTRVNQYTLAMDVFVAATGPGAAALLQTSSLNNTDDGDLFWQGSNFGQGTGGYNGRGTFTAGEWHRVVAAYDMAATPPVVTKYVDGIKQDDWTANQGLDNARRALQPTAILFADGDQDERREMWVNSIQIRPGKLSDAQIAALGGPSASGLPIATPTSSVTGQWDFDFADLGPSVGKPLAYLDGAEGLTAAGTRFGTTGEEEFAEVPNIGDQPAKVMYVPGDLDRNIGYVMEHLIPPNGGGTRVNQYTLILDVLVGATGPGAAAILQTSSVNNSDDGDLFWQGGNFGQGTGGYNGTGAFTAGEWHRVVAAYDMAANPPRVTKYVDGIFQDDWTANQSLDNPRRSLLPTAILFADGDQDERREWWVNAVQIRAGALSKPEIESLGGPSAAGIPVVLSVAPPAPPPTVAIALGGGQITVTFTGVLESAGSVAGPWTDVGSASPYTAPATGAPRYYRSKSE